MILNAGSRPEPRVSRRWRGPTRWHVLVGRGPPRHLFRRRREGGGRAAACGALLTGSSANSCCTRFTSRSRGRACAAYSNTRRMAHSLRAQLYTYGRTGGIRIAGARATCTLFIKSTYYKNCRRTAAAARRGQRGPTQHVVQRGPSAQEVQGGAVQRFIGAPPPLIDPQHRRPRNLDELQSTRRHAHASL